MKKKLSKEDFESRSKLILGLAELLTQSDSLQSCDDPYLASCRVQDVFEAAGKMVLPDCLVEVKLTWRNY